MNNILKEPLQPELIRERANRAKSLLSPCRLCPHQCGAVRVEGKKGKCGVGDAVIVSSVMPHHGEENCLSGTRGSGTVFFAGCNLGCVFCQNHDLSHGVEGEALTLRELAGAMVFVQEIGCHNLNLVTPTHVVPMILESLAMAVEDGFRLPVVYNCGGYESIETLKLLDGIVDIYMPDFKYGDNGIAKRLSGAGDYVEITRSALLEMHRQVGDLQINERGIATRGVLVRHLVLPNGLAGTRKVMKFIAEEISVQTFVNIMEQYRPCFRANEYPELNRSLQFEELAEARSGAIDAGLSRLPG